MSQGFAREARIGVDLHVGETLYYTANDTFAKADYEGLYGVRVKVQGAGGGGEGVGGSDKGGGGGGGGGYAEAVVKAADLSASETVTVGSGGPGGNASGSDAAGSSGGDSSFGSHATGGGGMGGPTNEAGASGGAGSGDVVFSGSMGSSGGGASATAGGSGGASYLGGGGRGGRSAPVGGGAGGSTYGGGGGGGSSTSSIDGDGGDGADGIVIVEVLYERKIAEDEDIHPQYLHKTNDPYAKGLVAYDELTTGQGSLTGGGATDDLTGLAVTFTADSTRIYKVQIKAQINADGATEIRLQGSVNGAASDRFMTIDLMTVNETFYGEGVRYYSGTLSGSTTIQANVRSTGAASHQADATVPSVMAVEDVGPV